VTGRAARCVWLLCVLGAAGCSGTTLRSGKPPGAVAPNYDERWHPAFLFGLVAMRERYDLSRICRHGWAEVRVHPDPFTALAGLLTLFVYSPSRLTIVCADARGMPPELPSYPAPTFAKRPGANASAPLTR
jgi:hypothetical protein